jgi:hypothetical protein
MSAPEEVAYASDQSGFVMVPQASPMPSKSTNQNDRASPAKVRRKIFHFGVLGG